MLPLSGIICIFRKLPDKKLGAVVKKVLITVKHGAYTGKDEVL